MYAIIKTGGKQYRVKKDDVIDVELLNGAEEGKNVEFKDVLFVKDGADMKIGEPVLAGFAVVGEVVGLAHGPKVRSLKYRPRKHSQKNWGHKQKYHRIKIVEIKGK